MMYKILLIWFQLSCSGKELTVPRVLEEWSLSLTFVFLLNLTGFPGALSTSCIFADPFPRFLLLPYVPFPTCFFHTHVMFTS